MEKLKNIDEHLDSLEALAPQGGEYVRLFLDTVIELSYETPYYQDNPELLYRDCFPDGLDADQDEIIHLIETDLVESDGDFQVDVQQVLQSLYFFLKVKRPVACFTLQPIFDYFNVQDVQDVEEKPVKEHFWTQNLSLDSRDLVKFYKACGLICDPSRGKGMHEQWKSGDGSIVLHASPHSKKQYMRLITKQLIDAGFSLDQLETVCNELSIPFKRYNR